MSARRERIRRRPARPEVRPLEPRQLLAAGAAIDAFPLPSTNNGPADIVAGPDGNLWFDEQFRDVIGRITTSGAVTEFTLPTPAGGNDPRPRGLVSGPGGDLWFYDYGNSEIGKITADGRATEYPVPGLNYDSGSLASGADGNLWFSFRVDSLGVGVPGIGRMTPGGQVTEFPFPTGMSASSLVAGPGGKIWFLDLADDKVGSITPDGVVAEVAAPSPLGSLIDGPDGALWYAATDGLGATSIVRLGPDGGATSYPLDAGDPFALVVGPGGAIDFLDYTADGTHEIGRITTDGVITRTALGGFDTEAIDLATGADGNLWLAEGEGAVIGRLDLVASTPAPPPALVGAGLAPIAPATEPTPLQLASYRYSAGGKFSSATIDWGDGTATEAGLVAILPNYLADDPYPVRDPRFVGGFVSGTHAYATPGTYHATVNLAGTLADGTASTLTIVATVAAVDPTPVASPAPEVDAGAGYAFSGVEAGIFHLTAPHDLGGAGYAAMIDWGDGTAPTTGTVFDPVNDRFGVDLIRPDIFQVPGPNDPLAVAGGHTYASTGTYAIRVTLTDAYGYSATATTQAVVVAGPLTLAPVKAYPTLDAGPPAVQSGAYPNPIELGHLGDFRGLDASKGDAVTIDWGDGTAPTPGAVSTPLLIYPDLGGGSPPPAPTLGGYLSVTGRHLFAQAGTYTATMTVTDPRGDTVTATTTVTVAGDQAPPAIETDGAGHDVAVAAPLTGIGLGSFATLDNRRAAGDFTATIDWGDGSPGTTASIVADPGNPADLNLVRFDLAGDHAYTIAGTYAVKVTVTGPEGVSAVVPTTIYAQAGSVLNLAPDVRYFSGIAGEPAGGTDDPTELATFTGSGLHLAPGDFAATIDWGDGSAPGAGTIQALSGPVGGQVRFAVLGFHTYAQAGYFTIQVAVRGPDGAIASAIQSAFIAPAGDTTTPVVVFTPIDVGAPEPPPTTTDTPTTTTTDTPTTTEPPATAPIPDYISLVPPSFWRALLGKIRSGASHPAGSKQHAHHPAKHRPAPVVKHHPAAHPARVTPARKAVHHATAGHKVAVTLGRSVMKR